MNRVLLKRMPNQFKPFQDVFGCTLLNGEYQPYPGTLFRFPLRTKDQARKSELCNQAFTEEKQKEFIRCLETRAGNLMLFLQNVRQVELYHLAKNASDPSQPKCLAVITKSTDYDFSNPGPGSGILRYISEWWTKIAGEKPESVKIVEHITISIEIPPSSEGKKWEDKGRKIGKKALDKNLCSKSSCRFLISWSTGVATACNEARKQRGEGYLPLAAVAIPRDDKGVMLLENCPKGNINFFLEYLHIKSITQLKKDISFLNTAHCQSIFK